MAGELNYDIHSLWFYDYGETRITEQSTTIMLSSGEKMTEKNNMNDQMTNSEKTSASISEQNHSSEINVQPETGMYILNETSKDSKVIDSCWKAL